MKIVLTMIVAIGLSLTTFAQKETLEVKTSIACDHCGVCGSCEKRITEGLYFSLKGIKSVEVDAEEEIITVVYKGKKTSPKEIRQAIAQTGFDADDVAAVPEAFEKLDACCKP